MQLARAFARYMPVLFVNSIGMRFPRRGTVSAPITRVVRKVKSAARRLQFPDSALPNLAVATPMSLPREALFYNRSDLHSAFEGIDVELIREREEMLLQGADAVLYASDYLFRAEQYRVKRAILIGHGVDTELFRPEGLPSKELDDLPHPRVGFFGELRQRSVDFDLIVSVARLCPSIQFVLGGAHLDDLGQFRSLGNVRLLPPCPHHEMPERWRGVDAAILPYKQNTWLRASEPVKLNEILAMGIPAVGTPLPSLDRRSEFVEIAQGPEAFACALRKALATLPTGDIERREARRAAANLQTWDAIADRIDRTSRDIGDI